VSGIEFTVYEPAELLRVTVPSATPVPGETDVVTGVVEIFADVFVVCANALPAASVERRAAATTIFRICIINVLMNNHGTVAIRCLKTDEA
jgi:hypothetical protein